MKVAARTEIFEFPGPGAKRIDLGHLKKPSIWSHPNTKGDTIPGLTEKKSQGVQTSSVATSVAKHHRGDAAVKAAARPDIFEFPGPGAKRIAPGHLKKPPLRSHPNTKGGTIPVLTEKKSQGVETSSGATSVAKHHRDDAAVKAAARPEIFEFPGPGAKRIAPGHLKKTLLRSHPNTKEGTIPVLT